MTWGESIVSHTRLPSFEYVLVLLKRDKNAPLWMLRHTDSALAQESLQWVKFVCRINMLVAISLVARKTRHLNFNRGNCSASTNANLDSFLKR